MKTSLTNVDYLKFFMELPSPHIITRADERLTIVSHNDAHAKISLVKKGSVIGKALLDAFPDNSEKYKRTGVSDLVESFRKVARTGKPDTMPILHYDLIDKNGQVVERWWRATHYPLFDENHKVAFIYQATEDITDEMKAQGELDKTLSILNSALEIGLVSTWSWDMKRDVVIGDNNLARSFGVSVNKVRKGLPLQVFIDSIYLEDRNRVADAIDQTVKQGKPYNIEYRTVQANGKIKWVIARGKIVKDEVGDPAFFNGVLFDITDRKEAEANQAEVERRFKALFDSNIVAILRANTKGEILQANQTFLKLFGYSEKDLKQGINADAVSAIHDDPVSKNFYTMLRKYGEAEPTRKEYKRKNGSTFNGLVGGALLPESDEEFMSFILDVTEIERLKELNTAKDEFIAMASHQLRTPASTVKQYLGILLDEYAGPLSDEQLGFVKIANDANNRQITIIEDLLKTAQIDIKGYKLNLKPANLVKLVEDVIFQYKPLLESREQKIIFEHSKANITTKVDATEFGVCIANLIENASKYSKAGKNIIVSVNREGRRVEVSVIDKGVGISEDNFKKVFEKFTRINNPLSDTVSGNGLGLYWVKRIVELHQGTLKIKSKLGKGTNITIGLPV